MIFEGEIPMTRLHSANFFFAFAGFTFEGKAFSGAV